MALPARVPLEKIQQGSHGGPDLQHIKQLGSSQTTEIPLRKSVWRIEKDPMEVAGVGRGVADRRKSQVQGFPAEPAFLALDVMLASFLLAKELTEGRYPPEGGIDLGTTRAIGAIQSDQSLVAEVRLAVPMQQCFDGGETVEISLVVPKI